MAGFSLTHSDRTSTVSEAPLPVHASESFEPIEPSMIQAISFKKELRSWDHARLFIGKLLRNRAFDVVMGVVILMNAGLIGIEQSFRINGEELDVFQVSEHIFLCVYIIELALRFFAFGTRCLKDHFVKFDLCLVVISVATEWVVRPIVQSDEDFEVLPVMVFRTARLARLARSLRLLIKFRELWMLLQGLVSSASTLFYTLILFLIMLYVFGSVGVELITLKYADSEVAYSDELVASIIDEYFPTLPGTMLTLIQFICMDDIALIYGPLMKKDWSLVVYFVSVILIISIVLMNIVTAVLVNGALEQASLDKEARRVQAEKHKKKLMHSLRDMFWRLDVDNSGEIDRKELLNATGEDRVLLAEFSSISDPLEIFRMLDIDGGGTLDIEEFCEGLWSASVSNTPIELKRIDKKVDVIHSKITNEDHTMTNMAGKMDMLIDMVDALDGRIRLIEAKAQVQGDEDGLDAIAKMKRAVPGVPKAALGIPGLWGDCSPEPESENGENGEIKAKLIDPQMDAYIPTHAKFVDVESGPIGPLQLNARPLGMHLRQVSDEMRIRQTIDESMLQFKPHLEQAVRNVWHAPEPRPTSQWSPQGYPDEMHIIQTIDDAMLQFRAQVEHAVRTHCQFPEPRCTCVIPTRILPVAQQSDRWG